MTYTINIRDVEDGCYVRAVGLNFTSPEEDAPNLRASWVSPRITRTNRYCYFTFIVICMYVLSELTADVGVNLSLSNEKRNQEQERNVVRALTAINLTA